MDPPIYLTPFLIYIFWVYGSRLSGLMGATVLAVNTFFYFLFDVNVSVLLGGYTFLWDFSIRIDSAAIYGILIMDCYY